MVMGWHHLCYGGQVQPDLNSPAGAPPPGRQQWETIRNATSRPAIKHHRQQVIPKDESREPKLITMVTVLNLGGWSGKPTVSPWHVRLCRPWVVVPQMMLAARRGVLIHVGVARRMWGIVVAYTQNKKRINRRPLEPRPEPTLTRW
jgi:hypothetical protein